MSVQRLSLAALVVSALGMSACGGSKGASVTERLWISDVPTSPRTPISAFLATKTTDGKFIGAFFRGSLYRGSHDVFSWKTVRGGADVRFLQDGSTARLSFETCKPSRGFDHCVLVSGDPTGGRRYQSRKRWNVRRGNLAPSQLVTDTLVDLAEDDEDLQQVVELSFELPAVE